MQTADEFLNIFDKEDKAKPNLATVVNVDETGIQIRIDGDTISGEKKYMRLSSYSLPIIGDRVLIYRVSSTIVVLGKVVN